MKIFTTRTRARYAETDASGIVYYNSYLIYFELGRIEMFRELELPYNWRLPIADTYCRYRSPARFDDLLEIHSYIAELRSKGFRIGHKVHRVQEDGQLELLAEGYTGMVTVGDDRRPTPLPDHFRKAFGPLVVED
ncbi:MAG: acyl-CoA thioesterase [Proteobacteria bacterium]|jgi:acyl-CoA thioester hydrolase|nr:acyl-CoA thioesterase [Pseudomonadota bacterium]